MALLNYAASVSDLGKINSRYSLDNLNTWDANDQIKLILTGDKHIITHGVDLLADYSNGLRGLVPTYTSLYNNAVLGKTGWVNITTTMLPMAESIATGTDTNLLSAELIINFVTQSISDGFTANDAMVFKGGITSLSDITLPYSAGYTYRATNNFNFTNNAKNYIVSGGDIVIAVNDSTIKQSTANPDDFIVVEANINGSSELCINDTAWKIYGEKIYTRQQFYAPTSSGSIGQVLFSTNGTPVWGNQFEINAGKLNGIAADGLLTSVSATNGTVSVTVGGHTETATASGNWSINASSADKVNHSLSTGNGLSLGANNAKYDGSADRILNLLPATTTTIGGVLTDNAEKPTVTIESDGKLHLTQQNIINALGYKPTAPNIVNKTEDGIVPAFKDGNLESNISTGLYVLAFNSGSTTETTPKWCQLTAQALSNTWRPVKVNNTDVFDNSTTASNVLNLVQGENVTISTISNNNGSILISAKDTTYSAGTGLGLIGTEFNLKTATSNEIGGIKIGYAATGKKYAVQLDDNDKAYVEVPWTDTNIRDIKVNGKSIGTKTLNIKPSEEIHIIKDDSTTSDEYEIGFGLSWYNISTEKWEYTTNN